jgi:hypothetical protein
MALIASLLILLSVTAVFLAIPFELQKNRVLAIFLSFWLLVYLYTEVVGGFNYSPQSLFGFSILFSIGTSTWLKVSHGYRRIFNTSNGLINNYSFSLFVGAEQTLFRLIIALILVCIAATFAEGFLMAPLRASDSFSYHIPTVNSWLSHGNTSIQPNLDYRIGYWPHAVHSIYGLALLLSESPQYLALANIVLGGLLWPYAIYFVLRQMGFSKLVSVFSALLSILNAVWFVQSKATSTDLVLASLFVLSLALSIQLFRKTNLQNVYLWSVCLALMAATKQTGMVFSTLIACWALVVFLFKFYTKVNFNKLFI